MSKNFTEMTQVARAFGFELKPMFFGMIGDRGPWRCHLFKDDDERWAWFLFERRDAKNRQFWSGDFPMQLAGSMHRRTGFVLDADLLPQELTWIAMKIRFHDRVGWPPISAA